MLKPTIPKHTIATARMHTRKHVHIGTKIRDNPICSSLNEKKIFLNQDIARLIVEEQTKEEEQVILPQVHEPNKKTSTAGRTRQACARQPEDACKCKLILPHGAYKIAHLPQRTLTAFSLNFDGEYTAPGCW